MKAHVIATCLAVLLPLAACKATVKSDAIPYEQRPGVIAFIDGMVADHGFDRDELTGLLAGATTQTRALELISAPAERRPWHDYRPIFVNERRIAGGVAFWREQREWLERAHETFGVDPEYIVAIIGVETSYGRNQGRFPVFDTLVTLGFDYPPRADFFRSELGHFLLLAREEGLDVGTTQGSYAGAMGKGQFISSSYRHYAIDFDGNGRRDLTGSWPDAIGSVANYLARHKWKEGEQVAVPARVEGERWRDDLDDSYVLSYTLEELATAGVTIDGSLPSDRLYGFIELEGSEGLEHWVVTDNFYTITRYNRSRLYAMATHQLALKIRAAACGERQEWC